MKRLAKKMTISAAVIVCAFLLFNLAELYKQNRIEKEERSIINEQFSQFNTFLKSGLRRDQVHKELSERSIISYEFNDSTGPWKEYVLLKRFRSPTWYCNYEDLRLVLVFTPSTDGNSMHDTLRDLKVSKQLEQCL